MKLIDRIKGMDRRNKILMASVFLVILVIVICIIGFSCSNGADSSVNSIDKKSSNSVEDTFDIGGHKENEKATKDKNKEKSTEESTGGSTEELTQKDEEIGSDETESSSGKTDLDSEMFTDVETGIIDNGSVNEGTAMSDITEMSPSSSVNNEQSSINTGDGIIRLNGDSISYGGTGVTISGSEVTIVAEGEYYVTGTLNDGRIIVNADSDADIVINLMGVNISNADSCCIYVISADKVVLNLNDGTSNIINDGKSYVYDDVTEEEPNAAIFSKDDLVIEGTGQLTVNGNFNNGIASKDDLRINGGTVIVTAVNNGLKGKDALEMSASNVTVNSGGDGLKADNEEIGMGGIYIESGTYNLTAKEDGMQAESEIVINGGTFNINSQDDSIHANTNVTVAGGTITMASADDGMHADTDLTISGGDITITKSYEGIEATNIYINGGTTSVVASDDGLNAAGGNDGSSTTGGNMRPGMGNFSGSTGTITFGGGILTVDASGDGIDSNGTVTYNAGNVTVYGPTTGGNGTLDYDSSWTQNGGNFVGMGTKDMAQMPSGGSQYSVMVNFTSAYQSGTIVTVKNSSGNTILEVTAKKSFQNLVFSNPNLANGNYTIYINGTQYTTFTISQTLTTVGSSSGGGMGRPW